MNETAATHTPTSLRRIVVPLDQRSDEQRVLLPATILARWFDTSVQVATSDIDTVEHYDRLAAGLGVPVEPAVVLGADSFIEQLAVHVEADPPSLCVANADRAGLRIARATSQATFLMAVQHAHRLATGPLVVPITGATSDLDGLAQAAVWATSLDLQVRLVVDRDDAELEKRMHEAQVAKQRLAEMGIESPIDRIRSDGLDPAIALARARSATAVVLAVDRADLDHLVATAGDRGVSILAAPVDDRPSLASTPSTNSRSRPLVIELDETGVIDEHACAKLLANHRVGRLGYVDDGWPVVTPVNITMVDGDVFIRSLPGTKVSAARRNEIVCLQVDRIDDDAMSGWTVLAHGPLEEITDPQVLRLAWENDPEPWVDGDRWHWLRLRPLTLVGRAVAAVGSP